MGDGWTERYLKLVGSDDPIAPDMTAGKATDEKWITFIGHGRSGHTIVSAILDSHPNVRMAEEQKYVNKWSQQGWTRDKILPHLLESGQGRERKLKALPGSGPWVEGEHERLAVGDKWGYDAVGLVRTGKATVEVLDEFASHMGMELKVIHTIRNPYDNICAWLDSPKYIRKWGTGDHMYRMAVRQYTRFYDHAFKLLQRYDHFNLYNDEIIANPRETITRLCEYLELPLVEPWLTTAADSLYKKPNVRSDKRVWPQEWVDAIEKRIIDKYDFFERFRR